jgi:spore coat polysaccharide biosynthesis predicted glycosyltransferase SpsG
MKYWDNVSTHKLDVVIFDEWSLRNDIKGAIEEEKFTNDSFVLANLFL